MSERRTPLNLIFLTGASAAQVVIQFLIQVVVAYQFGARADADALAAALAVPTLLAAVISGSLGYVLVPELVACFSDSDRNAVGWKLAGMTGLLASLIALLATIAVALSAGSIVDWLYSELAGDQQRLATRLLAILAWQILMSTLISWSLAVHHSRHSFMIPALGGVLGTLATLAIAAAKGRSGIEWIAIAINVGAAVSALIHVAPLATRLQIGRVPRSHLGRLFWSLMPLILGSIYLRIDPVVDRSLASRLDEGSIAHLHYAQRIIMALLAISTSGLSVIAFPQLAGRLATEGNAGFVKHFAIATRRLVLITVPIALGFGLFSVPVISDLLQRGRFTEGDSRVVGGLIVCFLGMFVGASWGELLARGFYTFGDTRTPTVVGVIALTIGLACKFLGLRVFGVWGIAGSTSLYLMLSAITMAWLLQSKAEGPIFSGCVKAIGQALAASLVACGVCWLPYTFQIGRTWLAAPLGAVTYAVVLRSLGNEDAVALVDWLRRSLQARGADLWPLHASDPQHDAESSAEMNTTTHTPRRLNAHDTD